MQFPLINMYEPGEKEPTDTFSLCLGENEVTEIRNRLAQSWNHDVNRVEAYYDGQLKREYVIKDGEIVSGMHFAPTDYQCLNPLPLTIR